MSNITHSKFYEHTLKLYEELDKRGKMGDDGVKVFDGSKVAAFRSLGISQAYYSRMFKALTELGCVEQVRRGTSHTTSILRLHHPPDPDDLKEVYASLLTKPDPTDTLRQEMEVLQRRLPSIDLNSFIVSVDRRLVDLERRLSEVERLAGEVTQIGSTEEQE